VNSLPVLHNAHWFFENFQKPENTRFIDSKKFQKPRIKGSLILKFFKAPELEVLSF
jgi:hypothetical protein